MSHALTYQPITNLRTVADTLPDYSLWLAGITPAAGMGSTDRTTDSETHGDTCLVDGMAMHNSPMGMAYPTPAYLCHVSGTGPPLFDQHGPVADAAVWSAARMTTSQFLSSTIMPPPPPVHTPSGGCYMDSSTHLWHPAPVPVPDDVDADGLAVWARVPVRTSGPNDVRRPAWDANIRIIFDSPEVPSPVDLLFGSHDNPLASALQRTIKKWYRGQAERLAVGWLVYRYIKWRTQPTATRYASLPHFLKPIHEQIWMPHPGSLDLIVWEPLRRRMLRDYDKYDMVKFIRQYTNSLRLRWSWDDDVLVTSSDGSGRYELKPAIVATMMSEAGWGLRPGFRACYPELFDADEWAKVVYEPRAAV